MRNLIASRSLTLAAVAALALPLGSTHAFAALPQTIARPLADKPDKDKDAEEIKLLATLLDRIVAADGDLDDVAECIAGKDRERVEPKLKEKNEAWTKMVTDFRSAWQKKYDDDFKMITHQGILKADSIDHIDHDGKHYAHVSFAAVDGKPAYEIHMVEEKGGEYRLVLPNSTSGDDLVGRLTANLKGTFDQKGDWPKEQASAYQITSHRLLYALRYEAPTEKTDAKKK